MNAISILRILLIAATAVFVAVFAKNLIAHKDELKGKDRIVPLSFIGAITDFFDTWGIGCFATTQAGFKFTNTCKDELMPGTLNVGHLIAYDSENKSNLLEVLECFYENECNLIQTSDALYFHKNTLKYKINKIQEILGCDIRSNDNRLQIMLALKIYRLDKSFFL